MSKKEEFKVTKSPEEVAKQALELIKENVPHDTNFSRFRTWEGEGKIQAIAESKGGVFHNSEIWVEARREKDGTVVEIHANDDKSDDLVNKLKNRL